MSLYTITKLASLQVDAANTVNKTRTVYSVFASTVSEVGELGVELMIDQGQSYKEPGTDGIVGEAIDSILCLLDLIHVHNPLITEEQLNALARKKAAKWVDKATQTNDDLAER